MAGVSEKITDELKRQDLPGAVWVTVHGTDGIRLGSAGLSNAASQQPMQRADRVHVGSLAKPLIALGIMHLTTQGRLSLETPITRILPDIAFDNPWASTDPVTVRHLLDQTSGLDDARFWQVFSEHATPDSPLSDAFKGSDGLLRIRSRPGAHHSYSNMGYTLLGMVIEAVAGERYEAYLDRELLGALDMTDSTFRFTSQLGPQADPHLAMGHFENNEIQAAVPIVLRPAGQFTTTAEDMSKFLRFLMGDGRIDGRLFIAPTLLRAMGLPSGTESAKAGLGVGYGSGMFRRDRLGVVAPCHGGSTIGFNAMACIFPEHQKAFFVAMNGDSETADYTRLDALLIEELDLPKNSPAAIVEAPADRKDYLGYYVPAPNRMQKFEMLDIFFGFTRVSRSADGLLLQPSQKPPQRLYALPGEGLFRLDDRMEASHVFFVDSEGVRSMGRGTQSYRIMPLWKLSLGWLSFGLGALGLGLLLLSGVVRTVTLKWKANHPVLMPFIGIATLPLPVPLFMTQSFLALGDGTTAGMLLMTVTAVLPLTMGFGIWRSLRQRPLRRLGCFELAAMASVLQCCVFLAYWGLLPLRLWA